MIAKFLYIMCFLLVFLTNKGNSMPIDCAKACPGGALASDQQYPMCICLNKIGDIIVTDEQFERIKFPDDFALNRGGTSVKKIWNVNLNKDGFYVIPFFYSSEILSQPNIVSVINKAISVTNALTCVRFEPATVNSGSDKIKFVMGEDCTSLVGRVGGTQEITVSSKCAKTGILLHELMHALGFWHEQSRYDRDSYVTVLYENILNYAKYNFHKKKESEIDTFGSPYDFTSVMQYGSFAFTKNDDPTLVHANTSQLIESQRYMLSKEDQFQIRAMYKCNGTREIRETTDCMHLLDRGVSYRGTVSHTVGGLLCQHWNSNTPHPHPFHLDIITGAGLQENYCRNPDVDDKPWCYTTDSDIEWQYCDIPLCNPAVPKVENPTFLKSIHGFWTDYSEWSSCSSSCGEGIQHRTRTCIGSDPGSETCPGNGAEQKACHTGISCSPKMGSWNNWGAWSECNRVCQQGTRFRIRTCTTHRCEGTAVVNEACNDKEKCPVYFGGDCFNPNIRDSYRGNINRANNRKSCINWEDSIISPAAYPGFGLELNYCRNPARVRKGPYCYTSTRKAIRRYCNVPLCQNLDAHWSEFGSWSSCSATCENGLKYRTRICVNGIFGQGSCVGDVIESSACSNGICQEINVQINTQAPFVPPTMPFVEPPTTGVPGCAHIGNPQAYRGTVSTTYTGLKCQHWNSQFPYQHHYRTVGVFERAGLTENYCRAPEPGDEWPWCYVLSYEVKKEICDVPVCPSDVDAPEENCFDNSNRQAYRGDWSTTINGHTCQRWDSNNPHPHLNYKPFRVVDKGLGAHNYCRNPDNDALPWCITTDPDKFWEYCNVPLC